MLISLNIQNVVLIENLDIDFLNGLCALTGETGAGKSILLDSLGLALGARSERSLLRKGADRASVTASFEVEKSHSARLILQNADIEMGSGENIILRRTLSADGRSKAYINDEPVSAGLLRRVGDSLVEIHGQFETHGLLNPATHRSLLDEYAGVDNALSHLWEAWKFEREKLQLLKESAINSRADEKYLRQAIEDLDSLDPQAGESQELEQLRTRLMNREHVLEGLNEAYHALSADNDPVRKAWGMLERIAEKLGASVEAPIAALDRASVEIQEALSIIQSLSEDLQHSEYNLEEIDERLHLLKMQARKHECTIDDLPQICAALAQRLNRIDHADDLLAEQIRAVEKARNTYVEVAAQVTQKRKKAALKLDRLVCEELPPLKLEKARFVTELVSLPEDEWGAHGCEQVHFLVSTNPGREPEALAKIASGGEMSRFMLALKVVMAELGSAGTLIFDEVDAGIGGSTADAVGERLARLSSEKCQVLVVTHAPQVAVRADHHWIISKDGVEEVKTNVTYLAKAQERREEIARMLAGAKITPEARAAADKLLEMGRV